jgi:hypothetical protein
MQADEHDPDSGQFIPRFPAYLACRTVDGKSELLVLCLSDSAGTEMFQCVPVFTDRKRCIIFGAECGDYTLPMVSPTARDLADFLMEAMKKLGADTVSLDPLSRDEVRGVRPISHAIQFLWRLADPEEAYGE